MRIGIPKEQLINETRIAATPKTIKELLSLGFTVAVEFAAGKLSSFDDAEFIKAGAEMVSGVEVWKSQIILKVNAPGEHEVVLLNPGTTLVSFIWPAQNLELLNMLAARNITVIAMDLVPRISRAQSLDALSSMSNVTGYRAVIEAAYEFGRFFSGQFTAAGKVPPAKVMVIGAGVAGLAAIGVAKSLGAIVRAFDTRPEVKEQVESMGAKFLDIRFKAKLPDINNCSELTPNDFIKAEMELFAVHAKEVDIIITTATIPGKPAPILITQDIVNTMQSGSIIVDLAAQDGGNCECTMNNRMTITANGVKVIGYTSMPRRIPAQASQLYGTNLVNLFRLLCKNKNGNIIIDFNDTVLRSMTVIHEGEITWPAPPIEVVTQTKTIVRPIVEKKEKRIIPKFYKYSITILVITLFSLFLNMMPQIFLGHFTTFILSCVIGYYVVRNVSHALHTPLMSVTNAISGIIIIGALLQFEGNGWNNVLNLIAIFFASINIFGGFMVTQRMLKMFCKKQRGQ